MVRVCGILTLTGGTLLCLWLAWRPSPILESVTWFPQALAMRMDQFPNARTTVPFFILGAIATWTFWPHLRGFLVSIILLVVLAVTLEIGQLFLPSRHFTWADIGYGILGVGLGSFTGLLLKNFGFLTASPSSKQWVQVLGIGFRNTSPEQLLNEALQGGLVVVPSGPGLAQDLLRSHPYRQALKAADLVVPDSGAMVLGWYIFGREKLRRVSGLKLLQHLLQRSDLIYSEFFWVHPSPGQKQVNDVWLRKNGLPVDRMTDYCAPNYSGRKSPGDEKLFQTMARKPPRVVVLCLGGGVQEPLGLWLKNRFKEEAIPCPAIFCTGAAIAFLSGNQARIPRWADRCYLGWLFRCISSPSSFIPRYARSLKLFLLIARYENEMPPILEK